MGQDQRSPQTNEVVIRLHESLRISLSVSPSGIAIQRRHSNLRESGRRVSNSRSQLGRVESLIHGIRRNSSSASFSHCLICAIAAHGPSMGTR